MQLTTVIVVLSVANSSTVFFVSDFNAVISFFMSRIDFGGGELNGLFCPVCAGRTGTGSGVGDNSGTWFVASLSTKSRTMSSKRGVSGGGTVKEVPHLGHFLVFPADFFLACKGDWQFGQLKENISDSTVGATSENVKPLTSFARPVRPRGSSTKVFGVIVPCWTSRFSSSLVTGPIFSRFSV